MTIFPRKLPVWIQHLLASESFNNNCWTSTQKEWPTPRNFDSFSLLPTEMTWNDINYTSIWHQSVLDTLRAIYDDFMTCRKNKDAKFLLFSCWRGAIIRTFDGSCRRQYLLYYKYCHCYLEDSIDDKEKYTGGCRRVEEYCNFFQICPQFPLAD